jgi:phage terminase small subunit
MIKPKPNGREKMFLTNYLKSFDPVSAFVAAGLKSKVKNGEKAAAAALLAKFQHCLVEYSQQAIPEKADVEITGDRVIEELAALAFSSISTACIWSEKSVQLISSTQLDPHQLAAIKRINIKPTEFGPDISVEMHDKIGALKTLARHLNVDCDINQLVMRVRSFGFDVSDKRS